MEPSKHPLALLGSSDGQTLPAGHPLGAHGSGQVGRLKPDARSAGTRWSLVVLGLLIAFVMVGCDSASQETCPAPDEDSLFPFNSGDQWTFQESRSATASGFGSSVYAGQATWSFGDLSCTDGCRCVGSIHQVRDGVTSGRTLDGSEYSEPFQSNEAILFTWIPPFGEWESFRIVLDGGLVAPIETPPSIPTLYSDEYSQHYREQVWLTRSVGIDSLLRTTRPGLLGGGYQAYRLWRTNDLPAVHH
jgi:hypothetical protein